MKRALGTLAMNWLRKPENQERVKRTARDVWGHFKERRNARAERDGSATQRASASRPSDDNTHREDSDGRQ